MQSNWVLNSWSRLLHIVVTVISSLYANRPHIFSPQALTLSLNSSLSYTTSHISILKSIHPNSPQKNPPPPPLKDLEILLIDIRVPPLDPRRQPPQPLLHRLGHPQRHLVLEDEEHGEHEEGDLGEAPVAEQPFLDVRDEALGFLEGVLGVVGGLLGLLVRAAAEDAADEGDERCAVFGQSMSCVSGGW